MLMIKNCFAILKCFCFYYDKLFSDEEVVILGGFADGYLTQVQKLNILTGTLVQYTCHHRAGRATIFCDNDKATTQHCVMASVTLKKKK